MHAKFVVMLHCLGKNHFEDNKTAIAKRKDDMNAYPETESLNFYFNLVLGQ